MLIDTKSQKPSHREDFAVLADHWVKVKDSKNIDKYLEIVREWKMQ